MVQQRDERQPIMPGATAASPQRRSGSSLRGRGVDIAVRRAMRGFTLIELLVVIAITAIILALLFAPLLQGFSITRRARTIAAAQDAARNGLAQMRREISQAAYVFDDTGHPLVFPIQADMTANRYRLPANVLTGAGPAFTPMLKFTKLDLVTAARLPQTAGQVTDPTTGNVFDPTTGRVGSNLRFPLAPGTRVVRFFIGLRSNLQADGSKNFYSNVYEFPRTDSDFNPFILYRAEFDPSDPNLVNPSAPNSVVPDQGGFDDPDFFYNTNAAANGQSYAANWARVAQPVMNSQYMDLLVVGRTPTGAIDPSNPFRPTVTFQPSSVTADTATPGFLNNDASELPGAVPTLYTTKYGSWTLPYRVTFYRGSSQPAANSGVGGELTVEVGTETAANGLTTLRVTPLNANGTAVAPYGSGNPFTMGDLSGYYCSLSPTTGKLFIKTPNLTYAIDPERGRIETGFPPLAGQPGGANGGVPMLNRGGTLQAMTAGDTDPTVNNLGELVPTVFRINTRDDATISANAANPAVAQNQGFLNVHLFHNQESNATSPGAGNGANYYLSGVAAALTAPDNGPYVSPWAVFAGTGNFAGIQVAAGTERVIGPGSNFASSTGDPDAITYFRLPITDFGTQIQSAVDKVTSGGGVVFKDFMNTSPGYVFDYDLTPYDTMTFAFKQNPTDFSLPGLPAVVAGATVQKELDATYYWQNNFTRDVQGHPLDAAGNYTDQVPDSGNPASFNTMGAVEADIVKVDYSTRALINVSLGARIYDAEARVPQTVTLTDKVQINNVGR